MKIKRKVEMTEKELIKYLLDHETTTIHSNEISYDGAWTTIEPRIESKVDFDVKAATTNGRIYIVEVEETVTEKTKFEHLAIIDDCNLSASYVDKSINDVEYGNEEEFHAYIDGEFKLIWTRDKGLVE